MRAFTHSLPVFMIQCLILTAVALLLFDAPSAALDNAQRSTAVGLLQSAIGDSERLRNPETEIAVLSEAGNRLRLIDANLCLNRFENIYQSIIKSPEILPANREGDASTSQDRYDLFRKFIRMVTRYDPRLAEGYVRRYSKESRDASSFLSLWEAAYDILYDNMLNSVRLAERAASADLFPDVALVYLERLRVLDVNAANRLASLVISQPKGLSANSRLALLSYVFPFPRVPELAGGKLFDRTIDGRPDVSSERANPVLVRQLVQAYLQNDVDGQAYILEILQSRVEGDYPELAQMVRRKQIEIFGRLTNSEQRRVSDEVARWLQGYDALQQSIEQSESSFQNSRREKYRNRTAVLKGLSLSKSGDYSAALTTISELPLDSQPTATKAILLYAAGTVTTFQSAIDLVNVARSASRDRFVLAHCLLAAARLAMQNQELVKQQLPGIIREVDQLAGQVEDEKERSSLRLGTATIRTKTSLEEAFQGLNNVLTEVEASASSDGFPMVHIVLPISGTVLELDIPSGKTSLYQLVRILAGKDLDRTMGSISTAKREDIRLRCIVAATAEVLSQKQPIKRSRTGSKVR